MNISYIDLHSHTTASDGSLTPTELIIEAKNKKLSYIAITDHDTMDGIEEAKKKAKELSINLISGVEMSLNYKNKELHILGYLINNNISNLENIKKDLEFFSEIRHIRNQKILNNLINANYKISEADLYGNNKNTKITRAHFAKALVDKGYFKNTKLAFEKILHNDSKFIPKKSISLDEVCSFFNKHNLFFSLAHPILYNLSYADLERLIIELKNKGMQGIEVYHSTHNTANSSKLKSLAIKYNLFPTGGSDFHGDAKPNLSLGTGYGSLKIPEHIITDIIKSYI